MKIHVIQLLCNESNPEDVLGKSYFFLNKERFELKLEELKERYKDSEYICVLDYIKETED